MQISYYLVLDMQSAIPVDVSVPEIGLGTDFSVPVLALISHAFKVVATSALRHFFT